MPPLPSSGAAGSSLAFVNAGYRVVVDDRPRPELIRTPQVQLASTDELEDLQLWRAPRVEFSGTSLAEAVVLLNRYGQKHLVIADHALEKLQLSGVLPSADNTGALLRLLQANFRIVAERRGEGKSCSGMLVRPGLGSYRGFAGCDTPFKSEVTGSRKKSCRFRRSALGAGVRLLLHA